MLNSAFSSAFSSASSSAFSSAASSAFSPALSSAFISASSSALSSVFSFAFANFEQKHLRNYGLAAPLSPFDAICSECRVLRHARTCVHTKQPCGHMAYPCHFHLLVYDCFYVLHVLLGRHVS